MAMTINSSPVLVGESARIFVEEAERNGKLPTPRLSTERDERTLHFYERNGFKTLYKTEKEERDFLKLKEDETLETRFMFFDLKKKITT